MGREKENELEWQKKQEIEQRRLDFEFKCKELIMYLDSIQDVLTDPINATSVPAVEQLQKEFANTSSEVSAKQSDYDSIIKEHGELKSLNVDVSCDVTSAKWNQTNTTIETRKQQLDAALSTQQENDQLLKQFAEKADETDSWIQKSAETLASSSSGDLEEQLSSVSSLNIEEGKTLLENLKTVEAKLSSDGVHNNPYTEFNVPSLKARIDELASSKQSKASILEKEILSKKHSTASPEQIEEFKEVFAHFDKNNTNSLSKSEFKSCLQSLGEDPTDDQMDVLMSELADVSNGDEPKQVGFENFLSHMIKITS